MTVIDVFGNELHSSTLDFFDERSLSFCHQVSSMLLRSKTPELVTLGYYFHRSNVKRICETHSFDTRQAIGTTVHYAPSNVGTTFAYFWLLSVLCGNCNVVRLSKNADHLQDEVLSIVRECMLRECNVDILKRNLFLYTSHSKEENDKLATLSDLRVIWGGDDTVNKIRQSTLRPHARDLVFSHKYSVAISDKYVLNSTDDLRLKKLVTDITLFEQNACTSPRCLFHIDDSFVAFDVYVSKFKDLTKNVLLPQESAHVRLQWVQRAIAKFGVDIEMSDLDSNIFVVRVIDDHGERVVKHLLEDHPSHNSLVFVSCKKEDVPSYLCDRDNLQTVCNCSTHDNNEISSLIRNKRKLHRVVHPGKTSNFDHVWDGRDLVDEFTNKVRTTEER